MVWGVVYRHGVVRVMLHVGKGVYGVCGGVTRGRVRRLIKLQVKRSVVMEVEGQW